MLSPEQIQAIRARADAATPGPWEQAEEWFVDAPNAPGGELTIADTHVDHHPRMRANAAFIARAREDVPALLAAIEESRAEAARLRHALTDCAPYSRGATRRKARIALEGRGLRFTQAEVGYRLTLKGLLAVHLMPRYRGRVLESACNRIHGSGGRDCRDEFEVAAWGRALRTWETGHA